MNVRASSFYLLSGYTHSVMGHGKQQLMVPVVEGTGAQSRPSMTSKMSVIYQNVGLRHVHPPVLGKSDCARNGAGQAPAVNVVSAIEF